MQNSNKNQPAQIRKIFGLLKTERPDVAQDKELREIFLNDFFGKTSLKDLNIDEAEKLIYFLQTNEFPKFAHYAQFDKYNKQHRTILSICRDLEWVVFNKKQNQMVADLEKLGEFLASKKSPARKALKNMSSKECSKIISALESITDKKYNK